MQTKEQYAIDAGSARTLYFSRVYCFRSYLLSDLKIGEKGIESTSCVFFLPPSDRLAGPLSPLIYWASSSLSSLVRSFALWLPSPLPFHSFHHGKIKEQKRCLPCLEGFIGYRALLIHCGSCSSAEILKLTRALWHAICSSISSARSKSLVTLIRPVWES